MCIFVHYKAMQTQGCILYLCLNNWGFYRAILGGDNSMPLKEYTPIMFQIPSFQGP